MEVIRLEAPPEARGGNPLLNVTFVSPIRELKLFPVGVPGVHRGPQGSETRFNFWDAELEKELSFEVKFFNWRFSTKSPMLIRAMVNDPVNFEARRSVKGGFSIDMSSLPWWAQEAWGEANQAGRRAIVLKVMELQTEGKKLDEGKYRLDLADDLVRHEERARRLEMEGKTGEAREILDEAKRCPNPREFADCRGRKHPLSNICKACHMHEMALKRKEALPDMETAHQENIGPVTFEAPTDTPA